MHHDEGILNRQVNDKEPKRQVNDMTYTYTM